MNKDSAIQKFLGLFQSSNKIDPIILTVCLVINIIVLANATCIIQKSAMMPART